MLIEPSGDLYARVINRINYEERALKLKRKLILNLLGLFLSGTALVPLTMKLLSDITRSGLVKFLLLLFTDFAIVMANVGDYVLSLLESTPVLSLALTLATLLALVFYLAKLADSYVDFKKIIIKQNI